jgi:hypothetical protein
MIGLLHFTTLVITTMCAAAAAVLVNWLLLRATFQLMRPATAGKFANGVNPKSATRLGPVSGTSRLGQADVGRR